MTSSARCSRAGVTTVSSARYAVFQSSVSVDSGSDRLVVGAGGNAYVITNASALTASSLFPAATVVASNGGSAISSAAFR